MNTSQLSERESVANTQLQLHSRREPLEAGDAQQDFSRPARPEVVAAVLQSASPVVTISVALNSMASRTLHPGAERFDTRPKSCEDAARAALDSRAGRTLTGAEWAVAQGKLLEFVTILRGWDQRPTVSRDLVMFEVPCQREL
jgi:hypothetical protein